ncbi:MAG: hypothetical protein WCT33_05270 [Patescibacteria group bacterium]
MKKMYKTQDDSYVSDKWRKAVRKLIPCQIVVTLVMVALFYAARQFINHHYFNHVAGDVAAGSTINVVFMLVALISTSVFAVACATNIAFMNAPVRTLVFTLLSFLISGVIGVVSAFASHIVFRPADVAYDVIAVLILIGAWSCTGDALDEASGSNFGRSKIAKSIRNRIELACLGQFVIIMLLMAYVIGI